MRFDSLTCSSQLPLRILVTFFLCHVNSVTSLNLRPVTLVGCLFAPLIVFRIFVASRVRWVGKGEQHSKRLRLDIRDRWTAHTCILMFDIFRLFQIRRHTVSPFTEITTQVTAAKDRRLHSKCYDKQPRLNPPLLQECPPRPPGPGIMAHSEKQC